MQDWDVDAALAFLSACRAYKPLLSAQRQHSTLVAILDFLTTCNADCTTSQLSVLLLDMAFIGCQSFKTHPILSVISAELFARVSGGGIGPDAAVEVADSIRALDKLDHCNVGLSAAACARRHAPRLLLPVLAACCCHTLRVVSVSATSCHLGPAELPPHRTLAPR